MKLEYEINPTNWPVINRFTDDETPAEVIQNLDGDETVATETIDEPSDGSAKTVTEDIAELQRSLVASGWIDCSADHIQVGDGFARTLFVDQWPGTARNGFLQPALSGSGMQVDITAHIKYGDQDSVADELEHELADLEADVMAQSERRSAIRQKVAQVRDQVQKIYNAHQDGVPAVDTSLYFTVRGRSPDEVRRDSQKLRSKVAQNPTNIKAVTARGREAQKRAYQSASPIAKDMLGKQRMMMSKAVASMFFFSNSSFIESTGTLLGYHAMNGDPIVVDRYARETGYNQLVIGDVGSGKSYFTKMSLLRQYLSADDCTIIMMDPLEGFAGINEALGGKRVVVGGSEGLNPLGIKPTDRETLRRTKGLDPFKDKMEDVDSFFENYFALRNGSSLFAEHRDAYDTIKRETYEQAGISRVPYTHDRPSPTIRPLADDEDDGEDRVSMLEVAIDVIENTEEYVDTDSEKEHLRNGATWFKRQLEPFKKGGKYENLGGLTEIDITDYEIVYLDMQQLEGRESVVLTGQQLISAIGEYSKVSDGRMVLAMDESRYFTKNAKNLRFLELLVRKSRHDDLSVQFVTQTLEEWFERSEAKAIADNCSMKTIFHTSGLDDEWAKKLDMNPKELDFAAKATAGDDDAGYSECLMGISDDEGGGEKTEWFPMHVQASDDEEAVIDFEPTDDELADLPGMTQEMAEQRRAEIESSYQGFYEEPPDEADGAADVDAESQGETVEEAAAATTGDDD